MSNEHQIAEGRAALERLQQQQRRAWSDWRAVGLALQVGKDAALLAANAKSPHGKIYVRIFGAWLRENGFDKVLPSHRYRLLQCMANIDAIEKWRASLDEVARDKLAHPDSVWFGWRRATEKPIRQYAKPYRPPNKPGNGNHRPLQFDQAMIKRAGDAMAAVWKRNEFFDVYKLAGIALAAALRNEIDVLELLPDPPAPKPEPRRIARVLELTA